jgi:hypothetical protein
VGGFSVLFAYALLNCPTCKQSHAQLLLLHDNLTLSNRIYPVIFKSKFKENAKINIQEV